MKEKSAPGIFFLENLNFLNRMALKVSFSIINIILILITIDISIYRKQTKEKKRSKIIDNGKNN